MDQSMTDIARPADRIDDWNYKPNLGIKVKSTPNKALAWNGGPIKQPACVWFYNLHRMPLLSSFRQLFW